MPDVLTVYVGDTGRSVQETLTSDDTTFDYTGSTAKFRMRLDGSSTLKVDAAAVVVSAGVNSLKLRYDPGSSDYDTAGSYVWWWYVTLPSGKIVETPESRVDVIAHTASSYLCSRAEVRAYLQKLSIERGQDDVIDDLIARASAEIQRYAKREFADAGTKTRDFLIRSRPNDGDAVLVDLAPYDLRTATTITLAPGEAEQTTLTTDDYELLTGEDGTATQIFLANTISLSSTRRSAFGHTRLRILGSWGFAAVPDDVRQAAVQTVAQWMRREVMGKSQSVNEFGQLLDSGAPWSLPAAARGALAPYARTLVA